MLRPPRPGPASLTDCLPACLPASVPGYLASPSFLRPRRANSFSFACPSQLCVFTTRTFLHTFISSSNMVSLSTSNEPFRPMAITRQSSGIFGAVETVHHVPLKEKSTLFYSLGFMSWDHWHPSDHADGKECQGQSKQLRYGKLVADVELLRYEDGGNELSGPDLHACSDCKRIKSVLEMPCKGHRRCCRAFTASFDPIIHHSKE